ncbi:hypothetical protein ACVW0Y_000637 [Pseudomonas sp. TE3786]
MVVALLDGISASSSAQNSDFGADQDVRPATWLNRSG